MRRLDNGRQRFQAFRGIWQMMKNPGANDQIELLLEI
jgi:hypothetical protein